MRQVFTATIFLGLLFLLSPVGIAASKGEVELKLVSMQPVNFLLNHHVHNFVKKVNERGAGKVKINFLGGPEISPQFECVSMCGKGVFDMVYATSTFYGGLVPEGLSYYLVVAPHAELRKIGYTDQLDQVHRKKGGIAFLGFLWGGEQFSIFSKKPFDSLQSLKGAKVRSAPMFDGFIKGIDAKPVTLSNPEMYEALQRGVVDAIPIPQGHLAFDTRLYEVCSYIVNPPIPYQARAGLMVNEKKWNALDKEIKDLIQGIVVSMEPEVYTFCLENAQKYEKKLVQQGMKIVEMKPEDAREYKRIAIEGAWGTLIKQCPETGPKLRKLLDPLVSAAKSPK